MVASVHDVEAVAGQGEAGDLHKASIGKLGSHQHIATDRDALAGNRSLDRMKLFAKIEADITGKVRNLRVAFPGDTNIFRFYTQLIMLDFALGMLVGGGVPTMNLRVDFLRPATGDPVISSTRWCGSALAALRPVEITMVPDSRSVSRS